MSGLNKVPQSLLDKSQIIKDKGGISKIDNMMSELPSLMQRNAEILQVGKRSLEEEERSDTELRNQMKDKWTRTSSRQLTEYLHSEIRQYETLMENAVKANKIIENKYKTNRDGINLLSKSPNEIASALPAATPIGALQNTHVVKDLRRLMDEVEALKNVREVLESEMKSMDSDALNAKLISALQVSNSLDEHSIIQNELDELIGPIRKQVRENIQEQEKQLSFIEKANSEFNKEKVHNETSKMRDEMLKNLASASDSYNELYSHLEEGIKFYNDLTPILLKFQTKVDDFVFARKTEKDDLMKDIQTSIARQTSAVPPPSRPPPPVPHSTDSAPPYPTNQQLPPYPTNPNPYYPAMPNTWNPFNYYQQQGPPPPSQPYYPAQYPPNQPPIPPRK
jgi:programmed cell death 6-interacting protein